jgi:hypothetical protein
MNAKATYRALGLMDVEIQNGAFLGRAQWVILPTCIVGGMLVAENLSCSCNSVDDLYGGCVSKSVE